VLGSGQGVCGTPSWWTPALEGEETLREYQVYDFDKAVLYLVNPAQKWVKVDSFTGKAAKGTGLKKTGEKKDILGHPCSAYLDTKESDFMKVTIWQCDDLSYIIPEKYLNSHTLLGNEAGNILFLGMDVKFDFGEIMGQDAKEQTTNIIATEVSPYKVPDSVFSIPASYKIIFEEIADSEGTINEITIEDIRQEEAPEPPPPPPPKPPKSKNRKQ